jgi:hypothetical protein
MTKGRKSKQLKFLDKNPKRKKLYKHSELKNIISWGVNLE